MRVLSIDFDYFPVCTRKNYESFPDGIEQTPQLSEMIWASKYLFSDGIEKIKLNREELQKVKKIIELNSDKAKDVNSEKPAKAMVSLSHTEAYYFVKHHVRNHLKDGEEIEIVNLDAHHDLFNDNPELDCGNWLGFLKKELKEKLQIKWVTNRVNLEMYGFDSKDTGRFSYTSIGEITDTDYDLIFLCRSDSWLPPHFDNDFIGLADFISESIEESFLDWRVFKKRNYKSAMEKIRGNA